MAIEAYPLCWPMGRRRTRVPQRSRFDTTFGLARDCLLEEIRRLAGGKAAEHTIISTNIPTRRDGMPYATAREPDDRGVAVYFDYKGQQHCFACDKWDRVKDNIQAIRKTIEALRGVARWGSGDMMERAFTGFAQLEHLGSEPPWWETLGVDPDDDAETVRQAYRRQRRAAHPDAGGDADQFHQVQRAFERAQQERRA